MASRSNPFIDQGAIICVKCYLRCWWIDIINQTTFSAMEKQFEVHFENSGFYQLLRRHIANSGLFAWLLKVHCSVQ